MNTTNKIKLPSELCNDWWDTKGVRIYSTTNHGNALGHEEYMKTAYSHGFLAGIQFANDIVLNLQDGNQA